MPLTGCSSRSTPASVYKQRLPKRKCEMNSQNERCYQLAISSQTETVVLFTFREIIINMMSMNKFFEADRTRVKYIYLPGDIWGECVANVIT